MTEEKKDLTDIMKYAQAMQDAGQAPAAPEGSVMDEIPIEQIDDFESLEDYAVSNPPDSTPPESTHSDSNPPEELTPEPSADLAGDPKDDLNPELIIDLDHPAAEAGYEMNEHANSPLLSFGDGSPSFPPSEFSSKSGSESSSESPSKPDSESNFASSSEFNAFPPSDLGFSTEPPPPSDSPSLSGSPSSSPSSPSSSPPHSGSASPSGFPSPATSTSATNSNPGSSAGVLEQIKKFSEKLQGVKKSVAAAFPFSILITGHLKADEKEKLLDILTQENLGIREIDLEPQFVSGRILIPRISEYAGIIIVQALRSSRAKIKFGPSDFIFSTPDTHSDSEPSETSSLEQDTSVSQTSDIAHPAENLPLTTENKIPEIPNFIVIDTLMANATLKSQFVEAESSSQYQEILEALQREIKYKAYRKGAAAIVSFKVQMHSLTSPTHYRIVAMGTAIRAKTPSDGKPLAGKSKKDS